MTFLTHLEQPIRRPANLLRSASFFGLFLAASATVACASHDDQNFIDARAEEGGNTASDGTGGSNGSESGGSSSGSGSGSGGSSTTEPSSCVPSESEAPVADDCGVFVSSSAGDDANAGSKAEPFLTVTAAIESGATRIYLCAEVFAEAVELPNGASIFGGLHCVSDWSHRSTPTVLAGPSDEITLRLMAGDEETRIEDLNIAAASAKLPGGSSMAVLADHARATFSRCQLLAAKASAGAAGAKALLAVAAAAQGQDGTNACNTKPAGGIPAANPTCSASISGGGGVGGTPVGFNTPGTDGMPLGTKNGGAGALTNFWGCGSGQAGDAGAVGKAGGGGHGIGSLTSDGYLGIDGAPGQAGKVAQGGGGGGSALPIAKMCTKWLGSFFGPTTGNGASGGAGGVGGCGGQGGHAGQAGGASIALASINSTISLVASQLNTADAGNGGEGKHGQPGQTGSAGGKGGLGNKSFSSSSSSSPPSKKACDGGKGGHGGSGGRAGGGQGGHSLGIAYSGDEPTQTAVTITVGNAGLGGTSGGKAASQGLAQDLLLFP